MRIKRIFARGNFNALTSCISTTLVLVLFGTVVFFVTAGEQLSRSLRENFTVQVLLSDSTTNAEGIRLQTLLRQQPYVRYVTYTSKEKATREQAEAMNADPAEFLGYSPIPASFELHLKAEYANGDSLARYTPALREEACVTDVIYPQDLMDAVNRNLQRISVALLVVALLLGFVSVALINNTMRMSVHARRFSIHTMKLVGAKWNFIRRPFMARAFWMGLFSSAIADALLFAAMKSILDWETTLAGIITREVMLVTLCSVLAVGVTVTLVCAYFSVTRHLHMTRSEVYMD